MWVNLPVVMNVQSALNSVVAPKPIIACQSVSSKVNESPELFDTFKESTFSTTGHDIYPNWLKDRPVSSKLAVWSGLGFSTAGAVVGGLSYGPTGGLIGAAIGMAGGGLLGKSVGDLAYSISIPPTQHVEPTAEPSPAQKAVNLALDAEYSDETPAKSSLNLIKGVVKAAVSEVSGKEMQARMRAKYQTLRLMDGEGNWSVPELEARSKDLLPEAVSKTEVEAFIDRMAEVAGENDYLMNFLGKAGVEEFPTLRKKVASEGASVLSDTIATAQVLERLTSAMADDWKVNDGCRQVWKEVADTDPEFWAVQNIFEKAKTMSVNVGIQNMNDALRSGNLDPNMLAVVLPLNILEATAIDRHQATFGNPQVREGHLANAQAGWDLAVHGPQGSGPSTLDSDGKLLEIRPKAVEDWDNLYATWNMDFISVHPVWPQIIAKLAIPAVNDIKSEPMTYIHRRALALQSTLYLSFLSRIDGTDPKMDWRDTKLSQLWGLTNLESSKDYVQKAKSA